MVFKAISKLMHKIPLVRLVTLNKLYKQKRFESCIKYYGMVQFGAKYQIMADLIYARALYASGDTDSSVEIFKKSYEKIDNHKYLNEDSAKFLKNFIRVNVFLTKKITANFGGINKNLNIKRVPKYMQSFFFHGENY